MPDLSPDVAPVLDAAEAADPAAKAAAIRQSLSDIYNLNDDDLLARDARMQGLFRDVADNVSFTRTGARHFRDLCVLTLGAPLA